jgi:tetratricopeptide (TPR) repeat protein
MNLSLILLLFFTPSFAFSTPDYREKFYEQLNKNDFHGMEKTLKEWESIPSDSVELLTAQGNFFYRKARKETDFVSIQLPQSKGILLGETKKSQRSDPQKRGKSLDLELMLNACDFWRNALLLDPSRLDLYLGLARLYQDIDQFESQYDILADAFQYIEKKPRKLNWGTRKIPKKSRGKFIPESIQDYASYYFGLQQTQDNEKVLRLAKLTMTFYPRHPSSYNSVAAYFSFKKDWLHALRYLLIASQKEPNDSVVLCNIGYVLTQLGKKKEAGIFYRKVIRLDNDPEKVEEAKKQLEI